MGNRGSNETGSKEGSLTESRIGSEMEKIMAGEIENKTGSKTEQLQGVVSRFGEKRVLGEKECMGFYDILRENCKIWQDDRIMKKNEVVIEFGAQSRNEGFARMAAAAYAAQLNPTMEEISDIKTAVSEAVTNAVIHGYGQKDGTIRMRMSLDGDEIQIEVADKGIGMENVLKAMEPLYTTRPDMERSGMGFAFMEAFMDELEVHSRLNFGTVVRMKKRIAVPEAGVSDSGIAGLKSSDSEVPVRTE